MRKLLTKIVQLLDGTPAVYGKRQTGQSVVELALITPILIVLLAGLVEIGWFANNYLNLLDVTRSGARRGAVLSDQKSPVFWDNVASYVPNSLLAASYQLDTNALFQMPNNATNGSDAQRFQYRWYPDTSITDSAGIQPCDPAYATRFFYNEVICTMITSMDPLVLNPKNGIDDIIVSAFSLQAVDATSNPSWLAPNFDPSFPQIVVAGRFPTNANECDVLRSDNGTPNNPSDDTASLSPRPGDENRDPFDINGDGKRDIALPETPNLLNNEITGPFTELTGFDPVAGTPADTSASEKQVGFSLFGNHKIPDTFCTGSDWTMQRVEDLMNLPGYDLTNNTEKDYLPSQGMVLVEMYWEHEMLLKIPLLSPVYTAVGNQNGKMVIYVWAAFPVASIEPHIVFP